LFYFVKYCIDEVVKKGSTSCREMAKSSNSNEEASLHPASPLVRRRVQAGGYGNHVAPVATG